MTTSTKPRTEPPTRRELEASLEAYFHKAVRLAGGRISKLIATERGIPDRLVLLPGGHIYLVELKALGGRTSAMQEVWHARAAELGTTVVVLEGRDAVDRWLRSVTGAVDREMADISPRLAKQRVRSALVRARAKVAKGLPYSLTDAEASALEQAGGV